jgi:hypothetical protein
MTVSRMTSIGFGGLADAPDVHSAPGSGISEGFLFGGGAGATKILNLLKG